MTADTLCSAPLSTISDLICRREVSPVAVTEAVIDRIHRLDPQLNAFITVTADTALQSAEAAEREIAGGHYQGPLHGVPVSLKDLLDTQGVKTTAGSRIMADRVPTSDATIVEKLRSAGAVIVGKTNMLEFAYGEVHSDYGPSHNPWNVDYGTNGSSSGSAAAVAAGLGYGSIGSDTGGSIRCPAAFCGIVGLKPTYGLVSRSGVVPLSWTLDHLGPMTRSVHDCALLLDAIAGHDPHDPASAMLLEGGYAKGIDTVPDGITIGVVEPQHDDGVTEDTRRCFRTAVDTLQLMGIATTPVALPHPEQAIRAALAIIYAEASSYHLPQLRARPDEFSENTRERLELGALLPSSVYLRAMRAGQVIVDVYRSMFRNVDLLVMPTSPIPSYRLDAPPSAVVRDNGDRMSSLIRFTSPFNLTGFPALSAPCGLSDDGLPIGIQFAGRPFSERLLFQVAKAFEHESAGQLQRPSGNELVV